VFEGRVAALGGVAGTMIETLPSWRTDGDVTGETTSPVIFEREANVENMTLLGVSMEIGTLGRMIW
jgi:hypothetical protein